MVGIINFGSRSGTRDIKSLKPEDALEMAKTEIYFSKLKDLGYSGSQITSVIEKLCSIARTLHPHLLGAVLYSVQTELYQQMNVSEIKQGLENIIKKFESSESSRLLYDILDDILEVLDFIIDKNLRWEFYYSTVTYGDFTYEYLFRELKLKELRGYRYHILPPSRALEVFLKYLSRKYSDIKEPSEKAIIESIKDYLRKKIKELKEYEKENLPKLLDESVERIIEIYGKLGPIIEECSTYAKDIETQAIKSLNDLGNENTEKSLPHDYYFRLNMINRKLHYAAEMHNYIGGILKMSYLIGINKVSIDEIMNLLNKTGDPLLNLKETYNLLSSKQWELINCEIMKRYWCTR